MKQIHGGDVYRHKNIIDFSANINPLGTPQNVIEAAANSLQYISNYPDIYCSDLRQAVSQYEKVSPQWLIFGNGAAELIFLLTRAIKPKKALIPAPTFIEYEQSLLNEACQVEYFYLKKENEFRLTEDFLDCLKPDIDMVFLCNPNNPTGQPIEKELLINILEKCKENQIFLAMDECFLEFLENGRDYTLKEYLDNHKNLFLLKAFTKQYGMAGIRLGYGMCSNKELLEKMEQSTQPWNISIPAQAAGVAALREREHVKKGLDIIGEQRPYLINQLQQLGFQVFGSKANYIFFEGPKGLYEKALEGGFLIRDCSNYPGLEDGYYRIAVKTKEENERLIAWLKEL